MKKQTKKTLIGSNQLWLVNDSTYYLEYCRGLQRQNSDPTLKSQETPNVSINSASIPSIGWLLSVSENTVYVMTESHSPMQAVAIQCLQKPLIILWVWNIPTIAAIVTCISIKTYPPLLQTENSWGEAKDKYRQVSNIRGTLVGNEMVDHSDVVGASPVGAAPTTSSLSTQHLASRDSAKADARQYENLLSVWIWWVLY